MKSVFLCGLILLSLSGVEAKDSVDIKSKDFDLEELIRNQRGEIENLKHRLSIVEQNLGIFHEKEIVFKSPEQIANNIKGKSPEKIIEMANDLIDLDKCQEARDILNAFMKEYPKNLYCGRMYFYIGKSYFKEKDYKNAAQSYMESFEVNPNGTKTPKALFRLSLCFFKLGKQDQRKITLEKLASTFPKFKYGKKAIAKLNELKS